MKRLAVNFCLMLMIALCFLNISNLTPVKAESNALNIVALGDSITTGYGLADVENALFVNKIKTAKNASLINLAHNGDKVSDLYNVIADANNNNAILNADCLLITIGGNDVMQPILQQLTINLGKEISQASQTEIISAFMSLAQDTNLTLTLTNAISNFETNFNLAAQTLRNKNTNAQIIFQTVYNPAVKFNQDLFFGRLYTFVNPYIEQINDIISDSNLKNHYAYEVCDTYTIFENYQGTSALTNIESFDIHPNAYGNQVIYNNLVEMVADKTVQINVTTIKIYTNNIYVNDPTAETPETPYLVGGAVEGTKKDNNNYDILEVPVNEVATLNITENAGFKLTDIKLGEQSVGAVKTYELDGANLPNTISIYFLQQFTITYSTGYNGYIIVDSEKLDDPQKNIVKQVLYGGKTACSITSDYAYEIDEVKIDGEPIEVSDINYSFDNINQDHTFAVSFKKIERTEYVNPTYNIQLEASTQSLPFGSVLNVEMIVSGDIFKKIKDEVDQYSNKIKIYDFSLKLENLAVQPNGNFTLKIPMPDNFNKEKTELYYVTDANEKQKLNYAVDENNMIVFETDHCSYYVIVERGEPAKSYWWVWLIVAGVIVVAGVVATIIIVKKKRNQKIEKEIREKANDDYISY